MAGDWIKMRVDLADDPAVIAVAVSLGMEEDHIVGKLHRLWSWANRQTTDGNAPGVTEAWLDHYLGVTGLCASLAKAGWLTIGKRGISIPRFDRHNGQSGKQRALTAKRASEHRSRKRNAPSVTREEKRREEKRKDSDQVCSEKEEPRTYPLLALEKFCGGNPPLFHRGGLTNKQARSLLAVAALLDAGQLSEHVVEDALEAMRKRNGGPLKDPVAYFLGVVRRNSEPGLDGMLAGVPVSDELVDQWRKTKP